MAVSLAIKERRLTAPAVVWIEGQPKIADVALADEQWGRNTDPVRAANGALAGPPPVLVAAPRVVPAPPEWRDGEPVGPQPEGAATATERLKSAQADLAELKRDQERGELVLAKDVERRLVDVFSVCKQHLLAIPSRARQALPHLSTADVTVIENLVRESLEELV